MTIMLWIAFYVVWTSWMEAMLSPLNGVSVGFSKSPKPDLETQWAEPTRKAA